MKVPDSPDGWDARRDTNGRVRYDSEDRRAAVVCYPVTTSGGEGYNCRLYEKETPYTMGDATDSEFAPTIDATAGAVLQLEDDNDL